jgi:hypothetical protein
MEVQDEPIEALTGQLKRNKVLTVPRLDKKYTIGKLFERAFI